MNETKQKDIAEKLGISASAVSQRIDKILYNYRACLCNDEEFRKTKDFITLKWESKHEFAKYINQIRKEGTFKINLAEVKNFIQEVRQAIRHTVETKTYINIRKKFSQQIDIPTLMIITYKI